MVESKIPGKKRDMYEHVSPYFKDLLDRGDDVVGRAPEDDPRVPDEIKFILN